MARVTMLCTQEASSEDQEAQQVLVDPAVIMAMAVTRGLLLLRLILEAHSLDTEAPARIASPVLAILPASAALFPSQLAEESCLKWTATKEPELNQPRELTKGTAAAPP